MKLNLIGLWALLMALSSCASDDSCQDTDALNKGEKSLFYLSLTSAATQVSVGQTRTSEGGLDLVLGADEAFVRAVDDTKIENSCVFLFSGVSHKLIDKAYYPDLNGMGSVSFEVYLHKSDDTDKMYVLANMGDLTASYLINETTLEQFETSVCPMETMGEVTPNDLIPMIGAAEVNTASGSLPITVERLAAWLKLTCQTDFTDGSTFQFTTITLRNVPTSVKYSPESAIDLGTERLTEYVLATDSYLMGTELSCFLPENLRGKNEAITHIRERSGENVPDNATYIEIKGEYKAPGKTGSTVSFFVYLGNGELSDFNVERNHVYTVRVTIKAVDEEDPRVEVLTKLDGEKSANCYVVTKDQATFSFGATVKGNGSTSAGNTVGEIVLTPKSAKVLWEMGADPAVAPHEGDIITKGSVRLEDGQVFFRSGSKKGNAVIAVYDGEQGTGNILWSWHIWKPEEEPKSLPCHTIVVEKQTPNVILWERDFNMQDRNLGAMNNHSNDAKAYGLLYQWGRKDPFPGAQTINGVTTYATTHFAKTLPDFPAPVESTPELGTIDGAIKHPTLYLASPRYIGMSTEIRDWLYIGKQDNRLWGNPNADVTNSKPLRDLGSKSIYDPCPPGWRVPPSDFWYQVIPHEDGGLCDIKDNGLEINLGPNDERYFFPGSGVRYHLMNSQLLIGAGDRGWYWLSLNHLSSTNPENYSYACHGSFELSEPSITIIDYGYRSYGLSVRCTSE